VLPSVDLSLRLRLGWPRERLPELEAAIATRAYAISDPREVTDPAYRHTPSGNTRRTKWHGSQATRSRWHGRTTALFAVATAMRKGGPARWSRRLTGQEALFTDADAGLLRELRPKT
jgi:hypothetical protein